MPYSNDIKDDIALLRTYQKRKYRERRREKDNWQCMSGIDYGQWNDSAVRTAIQEGRPLSSFNLTKKTIDTIVGSIISDPYELHYDTEYGEQDRLAMILNELWLADKDVGGFSAHYHDFVRAGFVYKGWMRIFKDRRNDPRGRVGFQYIRGDMITDDPDIQTNNIDDNKNLFVYSWLSPQQIKDKYKKNSEEIKEAIEIWNRYNNGETSVDSTYEEGEESKLFDCTPETFDQRYGLFLVVDRYQLIRKDYMNLFDVDLGEVIATKPPEEAKLLARAYKQQQRQIKLLPRSFKECQLRTSCPGLSLKMALQEGPYEYQLDGYPFFSFSSDTINGMPNTYVDILKDSQVSLNKRINTATHILMTSSNNTLLIESDAVEDENDIDKIGKGRNRPGSYFKVAPDALRAGKIKHLEHGDRPTDFLNAGETIRNLMQELTPGVPALQAIGQGQESGVLFQSRVQQAMVSMQIPNRFLRIFWERFGDFYIKAAKQTYVYPMRFKGSRTGEEYYINMPGEIDMRAVSRLKVTVTQSPNSETNRRQMLQSFLAIAQYLQDAYTLAELSRVVVGAMPGLPEAEQDQLREAAKLSSEVQKLNLMAQAQQIQMSMQGQQAQPGQPQGPGGGGPPSPTGMPNMPAPGQIDSGKLLEAITQNVQNGRRGMPNTSAGGL